MGLQASYLSELEVRYVYEQGDYKNPEHEVNSVLGVLSIKIWVVLKTMDLSWLLVGMRHVYLGLPRWDSKFGSYPYIQDVFRLMHPK